MAERPAPAEEVDADHLAGDRGDDPALAAPWPQTGDEPADVVSTAVVQTPSTSSTGSLQWLTTTRSGTEPTSSTSVTATRPVGPTSV